LNNLAGLTRDAAIRRGRRSVSALPDPQRVAWTRQFTMPMLHGDAEKLHLKEYQKAGSKAEAI
jgi:hypothetical protein